MTPESLRAQTLVRDGARRDSAFALLDRGQSREGQALLAKLIADGSTDQHVYERFGLNLLTTSGALPDAAARQQQRARARAMLDRAVQLGSTDNQIIGIRNAIPADGGTDATFSLNAAVDSVMHAAEKAYSSADFRGAFALYQKALALDPMLYQAALFSGDTFLHGTAVDSAYLWYARATDIDPNRETAWRYWSDVLIKHDRLDEGRDKAIEAMIADPYNQITRKALSSWSQKAKVGVAFPSVLLRAATNGDANTSAWVAYDSVRQAWKGTAASAGAPFTAAYPSETTYRHSLAEERAALLAAKRAQPDDATARSIRALDEAGLLEAYVLFARADAGIAQDYAPYRATHRDALRRFWSTVTAGSK